LKLDRSISLIFLALAIYILWQTREIVLLAFTAVILATVLNRIVRKIQRHIIKSRSSAVILTLITFLALITIFTVAIVPPFIVQFQQLIQKVPLGIERLSVWFFQWQDRMPKELVDSFQNSFDRLLQIPQSFSTQIFTNFFSLFSGTLSTILSGLLILVLTIMLLINPVPYRRAFISLFPAFFRRRMNTILDRCELGISGWSLGMLFSMSAIVILSGFGLWILGVPLILANALLAGLLNFIPNVGATLSVIPPAAIALLDAPWKAVAVIILYILVQQIETNILTPIVMQKQVSLLPAITLIAQLIFAILFGFLGLLLALPLTIVCQVLLQELLIKNVLDKLDRVEHS
jgi:predicted PurR-regulated permease PerM